MFGVTTVQRGTALLFALAAFTTFAAACSGPRENPFLDQRGLHTPTPVPAAGAVSTPGANQLLAESVGVVRMAQWDDKRVQFENALAGYIMVWGYDYRVDMVIGEPSDYQTGLLNDGVDIVLEANAEWVAANSAKTKDLGTFSETQNGTRLAIVAGLDSKSPELIEFLEKVSPSEDAIVQLSGMITGGRTGIKPEVAALMYLKEHEAEWMPWVSAEVAANVKTAIDDGRTSLVNRICIPSGANGVGTGSISSLCN